MKSLLGKRKTRALERLFADARAARDRWLKGLA
jgi:hypothetical protein